MNTGIPKRTVLERILYPSKRVNREKLEKIIHGKTILITGATYGIGECLACTLARKNVTLILVARTEDKLRQLKTELERKGATIYIYTANLQDLDQVDAMLQYLEGLPCEVDIFVNNAGKSICRSIEKSLDRFHDFTRTMTLNYYAPVKICLNLIPVLQKNKGQIINISSVNSLLAPAPYWAAYLASKSAFDKWVRSIAPESKLKGVAVTSIYPPLVRTRMIEPTESYKKAPAMQPQQMADIICRSIIKRSRRYSPWWTTIAELASVILRVPWEFLITNYIKRKHRS